MANFVAEANALRAKLLAVLRSMPYDDYLRTDHWKGVRTQALRHSNHSCMLCIAQKVSFDVHHRTYERLGCEWLEDVIVLCHPCHERHHFQDYKPVVATVPHQAPESSQRHKEIGELLERYLNSKDPAAKKAIEDFEKGIA